MIPLQLHIKNFLSYGAPLQTIPFSSYNLIALSGKNGHGKSALLDAITWALWGQARKIAGVTKADHLLLKLGQQTMQVALEFESNNQQYKVRREFTQAPGKSYTTLDFGMYDATVEKYISLTDKTLRDTQQKIESTIGLDYDSFINSAFLRQGQSNEFSKKSPKERKEILSTILGLNHYEKIRKLAGEKTRAAQQQCDQLNAVATRIYQDLITLPDLKKRLQETTISLEALHKDQDAVLAKRNSLAQQKTALHKDQQELYLLTFQRTHLQQEYQGLVHTIQEAFKQWRRINTTLRTTSIASLQTEQEQLQQALMVFQKRATLSAEIHHKIIDSKQALQDIVFKKQQEYQRMVTQQREAVQAITYELEQKKLLKKNSDSQYTLLQEQYRHHTALSAQLHTTLAKKEGLITQLAHHNTIFEKRKKYYYAWAAQLHHLKQVLETTAQKVQLVGTDLHSNCPLCEQNLSASRKKFLKNKLISADNNDRRRYKRLAPILTKLKEMLTEQHEMLKRAQQELDEINAAEKQYEHSQSLLQTAQTGLQNLMTEQQELNTLIEHLTRTHHQQATHITQLQEQESTFLYDQEYQHLYSSYQQLLDQEKAIQYNAQDHLGVQEKLTVNQQALQALQQCIQEQAQQQQRMETISMHCKSAQSLKALLMDNEQLIKKYDYIAPTLVTLEQEEHSLHEEYQRFQEAKENLLHQKSILQAQLDKGKHLTTEYEQYQHNILSLRAIIEDYNHISQTFSKDGIPALLIEQVIPELEQEANDLLAQLTNNQAHLIIDSLRDLKKGGTKETLDIKISDSAGIRPYEMFSGGEAFRIDFALRIAISKLLARRAGTALQTLIIDEGFGSQDEEGLNHIMDALYKIQHNFNKIIIVSHLPSMKDQFPVHFVVEKKPQGSLVTIMEQG